MATWVQWLIVIILVLAIYLGYIHGFLKSLRIQEITVDMSEKQVRRILGSPVKVHKHGSEKVLHYKFSYANRRKPSTIVTTKISIKNDKVYKVDTTEK